MGETEHVAAVKANEDAFVRDCKAFKAGERVPNPFVTNQTSYGVSYARAQELMAEHGLTYP